MIEVSEVRGEDLAVGDRIKFLCAGSSTHEGTVVEVLTKEKTIYILFDNGYSCIQQLCFFHVFGRIGPYIFTKKD